MYTTFLAFHSVFRWLVLISLLAAIIVNAQGYVRHRIYSRTDRLTRVIVGAISHTQLLIGFTLYFVLSPVTQSFLKNGANGNTQVLFFGLYHIAMMFLAVVVVTIGGSVAKRAETDRGKFKSTTIYFAVALCLILLAIPWFRPYLRGF